MTDTDASHEVHSADRKRALGSFYTKGNPFAYRAFKQWFKSVPQADVILEPFAGDGQIPRLLEECGYDLSWKKYDVDKHVTDVIHQDTLKKFPKGFSVVITNPPYLSYHFAKRKATAVNKNDFYGYQSLYQVAIMKALESAQYVAMIIPESFITSGTFQERLQHVISLPTQMFDDTDMPVCLAMWGPAPSKDFVVWRENHRIGKHSEVAKAPQSTPCSTRIKFNVVGGNLGLKAIDGTTGPSIGFCLPEEIPAEKVKHSARLVTRIQVDECSDINGLITTANALIDEWRESTSDVLLTAFKGPRSDGKFRRRLDYKNARALLSQALCALDGCQHVDDALFPVEDVA